MNADIIASFKRHHRKYQLEYIVDMIDAGKNHYKIDQLIAMRWSCIIWRNLNASVLANCWRYTTLLTNDDIMSIINAKQDDFDMEFVTLIQSLNIQNPMSFDEYINVPEEEESHELLTDEQLIEAA